MKPAKPLKMPCRNGSRATFRTQLVVEVAVELVVDKGTGGDMELVVDKLGGGYGTVVELELVVIWNRIW
jgi:hypothetical protein